jgi:molecular chaperone GrpE
VSTDKVNDETIIESEEISIDDEVHLSNYNEDDRPETVEGFQPEEGLTLEQLQSKLSNAEQKAEENYQKFLRVQADLDNFRRRTRKEKEDQAKYASSGLIEQLLPALDNFERALEASKGTQDINSLVKGIEMVFNQVDQALTAEGLEVISSVGEVFDPNVHQAVMQVESEEYESGVVVEELQKGYRLKDKIIRPAMVKVSM